MIKILEELNIKPNDVHLFETAFTHTSYANEHQSSSYERLEFLGDAVLDVVISEYLYLNLNLEEGQMTKLRSSYVCENALYEYALNLNFNDYVKLGHGELSSGGKYRKAILADIVEAFIGALYLDQGLDKVTAFVKNKIIPFIENEDILFFKDYKSQLQEFIQTDQRTVDYVLLSEDGPSHNKIFVMEVHVDGIILGKGKAHSKKEAEQLAAKDALAKHVEHK